jgi:ABC-type bacteriocin/lantibiotic exporter with double-glycine peptidase domain
MTWNVRRRRWHWPLPTDTLESIQGKGDMQNYPNGGSLTGQAGPEAVLPESGGIRGWWQTLLCICGKQHRLYLLLLFSGVLLNGFIGIANPVSMKYLFDKGVTEKNFPVFAAIAAGSVLVFTGWRGLMMWHAMVLQRLKNAVFSEWSLRLLREYFRLPWKEVIRRDSGYFMSRIYDETGATVLPVLDLSMSLIHSTVSLLITLSVTTMISWRATVILLCSVPFLYRLSERFGKRIRETSIQESEDEAVLRGVLGKSLEAYKTVNTFGLHGKVVQASGACLDRYVATYYQRFRSGLIYETLGGILGSLAEIAAMIVAGYEIMRGRMTFGGYMAFMTAFWMAMAAFRGVFSEIPELAKVMGSLERTKEFLKSCRPAAAPAAPGAFVVRDISFGYTEERVLAGLSLPAAEGEKVLVLGPNGCGKSTLAHLLAGFLQPDSGSIRTPGRERISAVIYPHTFVPGTVRDNLNLEERRGSASAPDLITIMGLSEELDQEVTELSAGQRKRLEVLMGLLKPADLYIFDEPLAGIDVESKEIVMRTIFRETRGKTLLVIMHGDEQYQRDFDTVVYLTPECNPNTKAQRIEVEAGVG